MTTPKDIIAQVLRGHCDDANGAAREVIFGLAQAGFALTKRFASKKADIMSNHVKRIAELEAALETEKQLHKAMTNRSERLEMAFGEVAKMLLRMAHSHKQMTLAEAAEAINTFAREARENDPLLFSADEIQEGGR